MPTTPDRLETAADNYREWSSVLDVAIDDAVEAIGAASGDESRAMLTVKDDLVMLAAQNRSTDRLLDLLAAALVRMAADRRHGRR
jgi:hypothetical protein